MRYSRIYKNVESEPLDVSLNEFLSDILKSSWSPGIFLENKRKKSNFGYAEIIGLDFDGDYTLAEALRDFKDYKHIIGTTKSHQLEKNGIIADRFRVILFLTLPVTNTKVYELTIQNLFKTFKYADTACGDAARFFYPCQEIISVTESGQTIDAINVEEVIEYKSNSGILQSASQDKEWSDKFKLLPPWVHERLLNPPAAGTWHLQMRAVWKAFKAAGFTYDQALEYIGRFITLDDKDIGQLKYAYMNNGYEMNLNSNQRGQKISQGQLLAALPFELDEVLGQDFVIVENDLGSRYVLEKNLDNEVKTTNLDRLVGTVAKRLHGTQYASTFNNLKQAVNTWINASDSVIQEPEIVSFKGTDNLTYQRLQFEPKPGPTPTFDTIMNNVYNAESMQAFIWSLLEPESYNQQTVWWYGLGGDGKGSISRVLQHLFGKAYIGSSSDDYSSNKSFFFSNLIGKKLIVFSDENNSRLLMTNWFKRITGDDAVTINPKGERAYSTRLGLKAMVFSNHEPEFDNTAAHLRRIIYCYPKATLKYEVDPKFEEKLINELPHILYKCKTQYYKLTKNHGPIDCDSFDAREIGEIKDKDKSDFFKKHFEKDEEALMSRVELQTYISKTPEATFTYRDFLHFLRINNLIEYKRIRKAGEPDVSAYSGIKLKKPLKMDENILPLKRV